MMNLFKGNFDYIGKRKAFWYASAIIFAVCLLFNVLFGTELDVSFKGGTLARYSYTGTIEANAAVAAIGEAVPYTVDVQFSSASDVQLLDVYTTEELTMEGREELTNVLVKAFPDQQITSESVNALSASMGKMFLIKCFVALVLASAFLVLYVALRFRKIGGWTAGAMALLALAHDLLIAYFAFVIFRIPLNDNFVAVLLTILGYSLNDTLVIYDRIRENRRLMKKATLSEVVNVSLNQSFVRNFNTALCTFIAVGAVAVVAVVLGLESITSFAVPMLFGVISGFYSSTFLCAPTWVLWEEHRQLAQKAKARGLSR